MNPRENVISLLKRRGFDFVPVKFDMCKSLKERFNDYMSAHDFPYDYEQAFISVRGLEPEKATPEEFMRYYADKSFKPGTTIDQWGVAREPGSAAAYHMTYMHHPMRNFDSVEQIQAYPMPDFSHSSDEGIRADVDALHARGRAACGDMACTVWETAWYMRGMENLMMDMMSDDPMAEVLLDRVTERAILRATAFARAGVDVLHLGDDIGMQRTALMSNTLYCDWLKPRLKRVIDTARAINPGIVVVYHSCGFVTPFIPDLVEAGIDVLNPVQPESMDFNELHGLYGDRLSFYGAIGTQTTMPFGTPDDVRRRVFELMDAVGDKGGLLPGPTHLLEPEVPVENVLAYIKACHDYKR